MILPDLSEYANDNLLNRLISGTLYSRDYFYALEIISTTNFPKNIFKFLSKHKNPDIRIYVICNEYCPKKILEELSTDKVKIVRMNIARNPSCPIDILEKLFNENIVEKNYFDYFVYNRNCPFHILKKIYINKLYNSERTRKMILNHPNWSLKDFE